MLKMALTVATVALLAFGTLPAAAQSADEEPAVAASKKPKCNPDKPKTCIGPRGPRGATGAQGPAGSARAYGFYDATGPGFVVERSKNIDRIYMTPAAGYYCVVFNPAAAIDISKISPILTPEFNSFTFDNVVYWRKDRGGCPVGTLEVVTAKTRPGANGQASLQVSFTIAIP